MTGLEPACLTIYEPKGDVTSAKVLLMGCGKGKTARLCNQICIKNPGVSENLTPGCRLGFVRISYECFDSDYDESVVFAVAIAGRQR